MEDSIILQDSFLQSQEPPPASAAAAAAAEAAAAAAWHGALATVTEGRMRSPENENPNDGK